MIALILAAAAVPGAFNPDVTQATIATTICTPGWTAIARPPLGYTEGYKRILVRRIHGRLAAFELDHAVPLALGGAPFDHNNLWLEPIAEAKRKDRLEVKLQHLVCKGALTLDQARAEEWPDWQASYRARIKR